MELTQEQAYEEYETGASYKTIAEKHGSTPNTIRNMVLRERAKQTGQEEEIDGVIVESPGIHSLEGNRFRALKSIPFHPVSGGGPFGEGEILTSESFPNSKYADWRLRNLQAEGRIELVG